MKKAFILLALFVSLVAASPPDFKISAPATAAPGQPVNITIAVFHALPSAFHYVDVVQLYDGDRLLKEWKYGQTSYERTLEWTISTMQSFTSDAQLYVKGHCTVSGWTTVKAGTITGLVVGSEVSAQQPAVVQIATGFPAPAASQNATTAPASPGMDYGPIAVALLLLAGVVAGYALTRPQKAGKNK